MHAGDLQADYIRMPYVVQSSKYAVSSSVEFLDFPPKINKFPIFQIIKKCDSSNFKVLIESKSNEIKSFNEMLDSDNEEY